MSALPRGKQALRRCAACGIPESDAIQLEAYGAHTFCQTDLLEQQTRDAAVADMAAHLRPLLQHRYKYKPEQFLQDLDDLGSRHGPSVLQLVNGAPWEEQSRK